MCLVRALGPEIRFFGRVGPAGSGGRVNRRPGSFFALLLLA